MVTPALFTSVLYAIIPPREQRIPITLQTSIQPLFCYVPYLYMCYLARRPNTFFTRVLLLPVVILCILTAAYRYTWTQPSFYVYNWGQCFFALLAVSRSLDMAFTRQGMLKYGESQPGVREPRESSECNGDHCANGEGHPDKSDSVHRPSFFAGLVEALDLAHTFRGLSYKFSEGFYIPPHTRPISSRHSFLMATLCSFILNFLVLDAIGTAIRLLPNGIGTTQGGSIFLPASSTSPWARYAVSTFIHLLTGSALLAGFNMSYDFVILIAVGFFNSSPKSWPPLTENPFAADSMHAFWSQRWHQLLRRSLIVLGAIPGGWIAGDIGMLFGVFVASGLVHECSMFAMDRGLDLGGFLFFAMQGPVLLSERLWRRMTGRRIGGWPGTIWVYLVVFTAGQALTDSWHRRGLGGGMVIPLFLSPTRLILIPLLHRFASKQALVSYIIPTIEQLQSH